MTPADIARIVERFTFVPFGDGSCHVSDPGSERGSDRNGSTEPSDAAAARWALQTYARQKGWV